MNIIQFHFLYIIDAGILHSGFQFGFQLKIYTFPAGISTLIQRWNNVMPQRWNDVEFWLNMKVEWTLKFWRWFNVDIWRCFNVDLTSSDVVTTFKFSWYLVEMLQLFDLEHWFFFANCSESFCLKLFYEQHDTRTNIINQFIQERNS